MIDLHMHTYYSDGTMSPDELVRFSKKCGIEVLSITDHDGFYGLAEGLEAGKKYGIKVIGGIELSSEDEDKRYMHILGYSFDLNNKELNLEIEEIREKRIERNSRLIEAFKLYGIELTMEDLKFDKKLDYVGKPDFARALVKKGYIHKAKDAFEEGKYMKSDIVKSIHRQKISTKRAIELIKNAGGIPVLAHPMKIGKMKTSGIDYFDELDKVVLKLKNLGIQGMECYYSGNTAEETKKLLGLAKKHGLIVTAGSDFHGKDLDERIVPGGFYIDENFNKKAIEESILNSNSSNIML